MNYTIYIKFIFSLYSSSIAKSKCSCLKKIAIHGSTVAMAIPFYGGTRKMDGLFMDNPTIKLMI